MLDLDGDMYESVERPWDRTRFPSPETEDNGFLMFP